MLIPLPTKQVQVRLWTRVAACRSTVAVEEHPKTWRAWTIGLPQVQEQWAGPLLPRLQAAWLRPLARSAGRPKKAPLNLMTRRAFHLRPHIFPYRSPPSDSSAAPARTVGLFISCHGWLRLSCPLFQRSTHLSYGWSTYLNNNYYYYFDNNA